MTLIQRIYTDFFVLICENPPNPQNPRSIPMVAEQLRFIIAEEALSEKAYSALQNLLFSLYIFKIRDIRPKLATFFKLLAGSDHNVCYGQGQLREDLFAVMIFHRTELLQVILLCLSLKFFLIV